MKLKVKSRLYIKETEWTGNHLVLEVKYKKHGKFGMYRKLNNYLVSSEHYFKSDFIDECRKVMKDIDIVEESITMIKNKIKLIKFSKKANNEYDKLVEEVSNFNTSFEIEIDEEEL
jgi:hypothetical protein